MMKQNYKHEATAEK